MRTIFEATDPETRITRSIQYDEIKDKFGFSFGKTPEPEMWYEPYNIQDCESLANAFGQTHSGKVLLTQAEIAELKDKLLRFANTNPKPEKI